VPPPLPHTTASPATIAPHSFKELRDYVLSRRDALGGGPPRGDRGSSSKVPSIMDLDMDDAEAMKRNGKGFA
jgi:hypothetical protein